MEIVTVLDKINEARQAAYASAKPAAPQSQIGEMERMVNLFTNMKNLFGANNGNGAAQSPLMIQVEGTDGQKGAVPLDVFFKLQDHNDTRQRTKEEHENKMDNAKTFRGFFKNIADAAGNLAGQ